MKNTVKSRLLPILFALVGGLLGLAYYRFAPCPTGTCPITSSAGSTMVYTALIGWLVGYLFRPGEK